MVQKLKSRSGSSISLKCGAHSGRGVPLKRVGENPKLEVAYAANQE
jgi:hypothetical protein